MIHIRARLITCCMLAAAALAVAACGAQQGDPPPSQLADDTRGSIEGVVTHPDGAPVAGLRVGVISGPAAVYLIAPETDQNGRYHIDGVPPGLTEVAVVDGEWKRIDTGSVNIGGGETARLDFTVPASFASETRPGLPPLPVISITRGERVFNGVQASYCWPSLYDGEATVAVCADKISFQGQFVPVAAQGGDRLAVQIEADEPPTRLSADVFESASGPTLQQLDLEPGREAQFTVDLPGGEYYVRITGVWPAGDVGYEFMLDVEPVAGPAAFDSSCEKLRTLLVSAEGAEEQAAITSYECPDVHVDSTGRNPSGSPSLVAPRGAPLRFHLEAEDPPTAVDVRLYSGPGISAAFFRWPEQLPTGIEPADRFQPAPSPTFEYLPQAPPGEYSVVVRITWEGPIDFFYAVSVELE